MLNFEKNKIENIEEFTNSLQEFNRVENLELSLSSNLLKKLPAFSINNNNNKISNAMKKMKLNFVEN